MKIDWKATVSKFAPWLGGALGGPLGVAAGKLVAEALGGDPEKSSDADLERMVTNMTPEGLQRLREADFAFQIRMKELDLKAETDLQGIAFQDRASAREREAAVRDRTPQIGFFIITAGFFGLIVFLLFVPVPMENKASVYTMLGTLGTAWVASVQYYFGSTAGSKEKNGLLWKSSPNEKG